MEIIVVIFEIRKKRLIKKVLKVHSEDIFENEEDMFDNGTPGCIKKLDDLSIYELKLSLKKKNTEYTQLLFTKDNNKYGLGLSFEIFEEEKKESDK